MSITPIENGSDGATEGGSTDSSPSGVWERIRAAGRWFRNTLHSLRATPDTPQAKRNAAPKDAETPPLPRKKGDPVAGTTPARPSSEGSAARPSTPGERSGVKTERDGNSFRVYDPGEPEAYVVSDEWTPVER